MNTATSIRSRLCLASADPLLDLDSLGAIARDAEIPRLHLSREQCSAASCEVPVVSVDAPPLTAQRPAELPPQLDGIDRSLEEAVRLGAAVTIETGPRTAAMWDCLLTAVRTLSETAGRRGVTLLLRNRYGSRIEQPIDLHRAAAEIDGVAFDLDIAAFHRASVNPCDPIRGLDSRAGSVRLSNVIAHRQAALDRGEVDIRAVVQAFSDANYQGSIVLVLGTDGHAAQRLMSDRLFVEDCDG